MLTMGFNPSKSSFFIARHTRKDQTLKQIPFPEVVLNVYSVDHLL